VNDEDGWVRAAGGGAIEVERERRAGGRGVDDVLLGEDAGGEFIGRQRGGGIRFLRLSKGGVAGEIGGGGEGGAEKEGERERRWQNPPGATVAQAFVPAMSSNAGTEACATIWRRGGER
jgi:hypothetical protein